MLLKIAANDWRNLKADRTLWAVAAVLICTIVYGVYNGATWVRFQQETIAAAKAEESHRYAGIKRAILDADSTQNPLPWWRDARVPYTIGYKLGTRYAIMPPSPLAALAIGQSDLLPYYFRVSVNSRDTMMGADEIENPVHLLSGRFDLSFVIIYLFPLLILALSYNLISAEKEDGTLAITLSQPISLRTLVVGKIGFRAAFVLAIGVIVSVTAAVLSGVDPFTPDAFVRLSMWIGVVTVYALFWFGLAIIVNSRGYSSATNAMCLAGFWLMFLLLIPSLLNVVVKTVHPVPSRVEMIQAMRRASDEVAEKRSKLMAAFLEDHPELAATSPDDATAQYQIRNVAATTELEKSIRPILGQFDEQVSRQQQMVDRYRFLSPAVMTQAALYDLAGTGVQRYKHFLRIADDYHNQWQAHIQPLMLQSVRLKSDDVDRLPKWSFQDEPAHSVLSRVWSNAAGLALLALVIVSVGITVVSRYRVAG